MRSFATEANLLSYAKFCGLVMVFTLINVNDKSMRGKMSDVGGDDAGIHW
jgi:hypothetical protein